MMLLVALGLMGLALCGLGAYGLVGRVVAMRMREIGIRMALGEDRSTLARSVVASALRPMALGGAVGLAVSFGGGRLLRSLLFEVSPFDPVSLVAGPALVVIAGALAALVPTLRALAIDPAATLRSD
jgi:ABC-type antimicrobial peptide transport system permease subunit